MTEGRAFTWLHMSDLHVGLNAQTWMWPTVKTALINDLRTLLPKIAPVDLVVFSGDLTQKATSEEFSKLDLVLGELRGALIELGCTAPLLVVPGNHDLLRPAKQSSPTILLKRWWEEPEARENFWDPKSDMRGVIAKAFKPYETWLSKQSWVGDGLTIARGVLPGDFSCSLAIGPIRVGVIGLNSAWLQLDAADYERKLHVDPRQILGVTDSDPDRWREAHDVALLVTHHPSGWLHPHSLEQWKSEIDPPGRFDAHLFGHMHIPDTQTVSQGGSQPRASMQAASVFGLEYYEGGKQQRIHGYTASRIEFDGSTRTRTVWPRILQRHTSGKLRFIPDQSFELKEDNCFVEAYSTKQELTSSGVDEKLPTELSPATDSDTDTLESIQYRLNASPAHSSVRIPEQQACVSALGAQRIAFIQAEWGLGGDGFVWSVLQRLGRDPSPVYRFDFGDFQSREGFFDSVKRTTGSTFEKLCALIARQSNAYVIFDNVDARPSPSSGPPVLDEAERIAAVVLDYCPDASIFLRSRSLAADPQRTIKLRPLDEADTATYVLNAPLGGKQLSRPESASKLHRITDGAPGRLDIALKNLQVVALDDLVAHNTDYEAPAETPSDAPETLIRAIADVRDSDDPQITRAYDLLKTLTVFPQGEQLEAIARFNNAFPFFARHATELLDRGLIDAQPISEVAPSDPGTEIRVLTVSRTVREYIRAQLNADELRKLDERALEVYFGPDWKSGDISSPVGRRFHEPLQHGYKIANGNALLMRLLLRAPDGADEELRTAFRVIASYFAALLKGDHYRSLIALAGDLSGHLDVEGLNRETSILKVQYGRALRMAGEGTRARDLLETVDMSLLSRDLRQSALLNLALCYEKLGDPRAKDVAEQVIKLGKMEAPALQAQAIIIEQTEVGQTRAEKLRELEEKAKRKKYFVLANNIALDRAEEGNLSDEEMNALLMDVLVRAREGKDFYNGMRAIVKISTVLLGRGEQLNDVQKNRLIDAYHFLFNERLSAMFDRCHSALWTQFERSADIENLLRLFRHSSLIWRLRDAEKQEREYVKRLAGRVRPNSNVAAMVPREAAYFLARASAAIAQKNPRRKQLPGPR